MDKDLPTADFVLASGSLNYRSPDRDFIGKAIARLYAACRRGLGFNLLRRIAPDGPLVAYKPEQILSCCRKLSNRVALVDNYAAEEYSATQKYIYTSRLTFSLSIFL